MMPLAISVMAVVPFSVSKALPRACAIRHAGAARTKRVLPAFVRMIGRPRPPPSSSTSAAQPSEIRILRLRVSVDRSWWCVPAYCRTGRGLYPEYDYE